MSVFRSVEATADERAAPRLGDNLVAEPDAVMDRAFTVVATPERVWPWLVQLGKRRGGWYLPASVERFIPPKRRALHAIAPQWQELQVGDVVPDYGGRNETFEVAVVQPPECMVYRSRRGVMNVSWSITLHRASGPGIPDCTRVHLRLRLGPVRHRWLVNTAGELIDQLTIAGLAAGLRERLAAPV